MNKSLFVLLTTALMMIPATACPAQQESSPVDLRDDQIFDLTIRGVAPVRPALQFRLFPPNEQLIHRNAAVYYHRAVRSMQALYSGIRENNLKRPGNKIPDLYEDFENWMDSPLDQMPVDDMRAWVDRHEDVFVELNRARNSKSCDWQIVPDPSEDLNLFSLKLDELQQLRSICRMLAIAIRIATYDRDYDTAVLHLQTGFKIAHDVAKCPVLVASLIGVACTGIMSDQLTRVIQQPDSPNLYWPLVDMPERLTDVRTATRHELSTLSGPQNVIKSYRDPENSLLTNEGWRKMLAADFGNISMFAQMDENEIVPLMGMFVVRGYPVAKQALIESGWDPARIEKMSAIQVVAIHQKRSNESLCHEFLKALQLPYEEMTSQIQGVENRIESNAQSPFAIRDQSIHDVSLIPFLEFFLPAIQQVFHAEARTTRDLAAIRTLEAIRAHAAASGSLPKTLDDISVVPVPNNPATDKPFEYRLTRDGAVLENYGYMKHSWKHYRIRLAR